MYTRPMCRSLYKILKSILKTSAKPGLMGVLAEVKEVDHRFAHRHGRGKLETPMRRLPTATTTVPRASTAPACKALSRVGPSTRVYEAPNRGPSIVHSIRTLNASIQLDHPSRSMGTPPATIRLCQCLQVPSIRQAAFALGALGFRAISMDSRSKTLTISLRLPTLTWLPPRLRTRLPAFLCTAAILRQRRQGGTREWLSQRCWRWPVPICALW
mmetsp:Transcript_91191/g.260426  ORF Transcript_91191/g.260426 Transcript_91191/m.260426 type:complete len:214 (-) Transcript_91191:1344-1985(-)